MTQFLADKMAAISASIRKSADASGYGQFVSAEQIQQWSYDIVSAVSEVEKKYGFVPFHQAGTTTTQTTTTQHPDQQEVPGEAVTLPEQPVVVAGEAVVEEKRIEKKAADDGEEATPDEI